MTNTFNFKKWLIDNDITLTTIQSVMTSDKTSYFEFLDEFKSNLLEEITDLVICNLSWYEVSFEELNNALSGKTLVHSIMKFGQVFGFDQSTIKTYIDMITNSDLDLRLSTSSPVADIVTILSHQATLYKMKECKDCVDYILKD